MSYFRPEFIAWKLVFSEFLVLQLFCHLTGATVSRGISSSCRVPHPDRSNCTGELQSTYVLLDSFSTSPSPGTPGAQSELHCSELVALSG